MATTEDDIIREYHDYLSSHSFPCVAAKAAVARNQVSCLVAADMDSAEEDRVILSFLYDFVDIYRETVSPFQSTAVIFKNTVLSEEEFEILLWKKLQNIALLDGEQYGYDPRVSSDPSSGAFSFSIKEEAFFIIGLHPFNSRESRRFRYPALVFNPHASFQHLRETGSYEKMKEIVRRRDIALSGSINPMLDDFGNSSEVLQYSGKKYDVSWKCPLQNKHGTTQNNPAT